jgi:hypothetical protein
MEPGGTMVVRGSGADVGGTSDAFHYVYQPMTGDGVVVTRIAAIASPPTDASEKAGLMIRDGLAASAANAFLFTTPTSAGGYGWTARSMAGSAATTTPSASGCGGGAVPFWTKLVRSGNDFSGYCSADGVTWIPVASSSIAMPASVLVGLAVTSHNNAAGVLGAATFDSVSLGPAPVSTPYSGAPFSVGATQAHWYRVEGEFYDKGAQGVAYWDTTAGNAGGALRTDDVDIEAYCGSGCYDVFQIAPGEWSKYSINAVAGTYMLQLGVSSNGVSHMHINDTDGSNLTGSLTVASTGAISTFQTQSQSVTFPLSSGGHTLQIVFDDGSMDLNWIQLERQ